MATAFEPYAETSREWGFRSHDANPETSDGAAKNVGNAERQLSLAAGAILAVLGLTRGNLPGLLVAGTGGALAYRGVTGYCHMYNALGVNTADAQAKRFAEGREEGIHVVESFLIDKSPDELYKFWRNLENLPRIMSHLESVRVIDEKRSHWIAKAPKVAGGSMEWDAEITSDEPNSRISWQSLPGADLENRGSVEFKRAPGDRGTAVLARLQYLPPAGQLGQVIAKLFGHDPQTLIRADLRNFKRLMEIGEVVTTEGQPRGACFAGVGRLMQ
jgi:uncharacterized membrane protein